jgi:hypothetical protein
VPPLVLGNGLGGFTDDGRGYTIVLDVAADTLLSHRETSKWTCGWKLARSPKVWTTEHTIVGLHLLSRAIVTPHIVVPRQRRLVIGRPHAQDRTFEGVPL